MLTTFGEKTTMGIDMDLINPKLAEMLKELDSLGTIRSQGIDDYLSDEESKQSTLRAFEILAQCVTDISSHIVVQNDWGNAESYGQSLDTLSMRGVISQDLTRKLRSFIAMNYLIRTFPTSDYKAIWDAIQSTSEDVKIFIDNVRSYLEEIVH